MAKVPQGAKQLDHAPPLLRSGGSGFTEPRRKNNPQHRMPDAAHRKLKSASLRLLTFAPPVGG